MAKRFPNKRYDLYLDSVTVGTRILNVAQSRKIEALVMAASVAARRNRDIVVLDTCTTGAP